MSTDILTITPQLQGWMKLGSDKARGLDGVHIENGWAVCTDGTKLLSRAIEGVTSWPGDKSDQPSRGLRVWISGPKLTGADTAEVPLNAEGYEERTTLTVISQKGKPLVVHVEAEQSRSLPFPPWTRVLGEGQPITAGFSLDLKVLQGILDGFAARGSHFVCFGQVGGYLDPVRVWDDQGTLGVIMPVRWDDDGDDGRQGNDGVMMRARAGGV